MEGLRGRLAAADALLDEAERDAEGSPAARAHVRLERGRLRRSAGDAGAALPLFSEAFDLASLAGDGFLAADAAHMAALAAPDPKTFDSWTERGLALAAAPESRATYWLGPLLNNHGWARLDAGDHEGALDAFRRALEARERDPERPVEREVARYAVARALRALGRAGEAAALLEQAVAWTERAGTPDGWFHEELAEAYAALGREEDARRHARLALGLLDGDETRLARLRVLAAG